MTVPRLEDALQRAHADRDLRALVRLYTLAGKRAGAASDIDAACFFLTQALVYALQAGHPDKDMLIRRLAEHGRV